VVQLAFIPPPNGVPFWWGHSAVLSKDRDGGVISYNRSGGIAISILVDRLAIDSSQTTSD
jgi:hypothetical protein